MPDNLVTREPIELLDAPHVRELANEIFEEDCYHFAQIPEGTIVLDVGACYGVFGIRCAVEKRSRVVAYEPATENRAILAANRQLNRLTDDQLCISPLAIGAPGRRAFVYHPQHPAGSRLARTGADAHGPCGITYEVEVVALAGEIRAARERWGDLPIVLKMDCEGAEREIFAAYPDWVDQVQVLAMEWHDHDGASFQSLLESRGFEVLVEGGGPEPRPRWDSSTKQWTWRGQPWGDVGGGLLFARRRPPPGSATTATTTAARRPERPRHRGNS